MTVSKYSPIFRFATFKPTTMNNKKITVKGTEIVIFQREDDDYISLTDIARSKNPKEPRFVVQNWMKTRYTVDFLGIWEELHNPNFNRVEFDTFKNNEISHGKSGYQKTGR